MFSSDTFPHVQQTFVTTVLETGQLKFLASLFLSSEEIQKIVDENSMKEFNEEVDADSHGSHACAGTRCLRRF